MTLGPDPTICTDVLVAAMRARLDALDPPAGGNVDAPDVRANFAALGAAVHAILTAPGRAQVRSGAADDVVFWGWVAAVTAHGEALSAWHAGWRDAVTAWTPADTAAQQFRTALLALPPPPAPPAPPTSLAGVIR